MLNGERLIDLRRYFSYSNIRRTTTKTENGTIILFLNPSKNGRGARCCF